MIRTLAVLLGLASIGAAAANAATLTACPKGTEAALHDVALPRVRAAALQQRRLAILAVGGSATSGAAAGDAAHSYPARLAARLSAGLPDTQVTMTVRAVNRSSAHAMVERLDADLADSRPSLVIWGVGGLEAGRHVDLDRFTRTLQRGIAKAHQAGADVIIMDLLYAPSLARLADLTTYRDATLTVATGLGVHVLNRHDLMRQWHDDGQIDLDAIAPAARLAVAAQLFDCFAAILADGIVAAVRRE